MKYRISIILAKYLEFKGKTIEELSMSLNITNPAISRRLQKLLSLDIITRNGMDTGNYLYVHPLHEFGRLLFG